MAGGKQWQEARRNKRNGRLAAYGHGGSGSRSRRGGGRLSRKDREEDEAVAEENIGANEEGTVEWEEEDGFLGGGKLDLKTLLLLMVVGWEGIVGIGYRKC